MADSHKDALKTLTPVEIGGDYETFLEETGRILDDVSARGDDLSGEMLPSTAIELLAEWEKAYGIIPLTTGTGTEFFYDLNEYGDPYTLGTSITTRRTTLTDKVKEFGSLHKDFLITISEQRGVFIVIEEPLQFIIGVDVVGDRLGAPHTFEVRMNESDQHRFPFIIGTSVVGDKLVEYDVQNSLESIIEKYKRASSCSLFYVYNWGFENDFVDWIQGDAVIDAVTMYAGTKSAKLEASGIDVLGPSLRAIEINAAYSYQMIFYVNVTNYTTGNFIAKLNYYDDILGIGTLLQTETLFTKTSVTAGFVTESFTVGQLLDSPDFIIPAGSKSITVAFEWDSTPTGIAYIDNFSFNFAD